MDGWVKLHRKLLETSWIGRPNIVALFTHLLLNANHQDKKFFWNHEEITIKKGQQITGLKSLSQKTGLTIQQVRTGLRILEESQTLTIKTTNKFSVVTICNWDLYQSTNKQLTNKQQTTNKQLTTNKNVRMKERKNIVSKDTSDAESINDFISLFSHVNPNYKRLYPNKTQRAALERMIREHGIDKMRRVMSVLPETLGKPFAPSITTPLQLESKLGNLIAYLQKESSKGQKFSVEKI